MKRFVFILCAIFICTVAFAQTIRWHVGDSIIRTDTCSSGDSITPPTAPAKTGYNFVEWTAFRQVEYLESTGTQWIDTGVRPTNDTRVKVTAQFLLLSIGDWDNIVGSKANENLSETRFYPFGTNRAYSSFRFTYGLNQIYKPWDLNVHTVDFNNSNRQVVFDGFVVGTLNDSTYTSASAIPMTLFAYNMTTGIDTTSLSVARIYEYEVYQNGVLVQKLIPALDGNGTPCMYDKVTKQFFYNQGTGQFIAGPVVN